MMHCNNELNCATSSYQITQLSLLGEIRDEISLDTLRNYHSPQPLPRRLLNFTRLFRVSASLS